ncbi:semaphorin-3B [Ictalurus furcatus]|uniref:semaphorin-3B n=1 Tax=Ictalurus furcatus TaxID=66913 RepID=UPI00234FE31D|nr:semaphorin-3B [Ictalurus furcatus]XP_053481391.1 semaphorin-3B [Ictalurus furcatus]XP_053481392.1 semaphorin-3B [Ictalurus furcatus]XP_053481393.1 semaphorin-3B [Ictalurus furcatus]XP_053481394.1 semaphorin-3B [Ictalurus furcatus]
MMMTLIVLVMTVMLNLITVSSSSSGSSAFSTSSSSSPRMKLTYKELQQFNGVKRFELDRTCCFGSLLLDEERGRLFVGARNYLLSLSLDNIAKQEQKIYWPAPVEWREECNWAGKDINMDCVNYVKVLHHFNRTHLYACGTGAFHPTCAYVEVGQKVEDHVFRFDQSLVEDGKGKSPYDPRHTAASVLVGDELYSGVATDLMGRDFTIFRSLGQKPSIRTEQHDSRWLNEPKFIGAFAVPESENPDDDKVFFFFRETAVEAQGFGKVTYARIGQLCRNDMGGQRSLVNKWTTFLKTRLVCSVPGNDGGETHFDELRDVFLLQTRDRKNPLVYTVFSTSSSVFRGSAVCLYTMNDIRRAFLGPFAHKEGPNYQWVPFQGKVPYPRPGMCPSKTFGSFESTKGFPDNVIQFARHHPLMYNPVTPLGGRPLFLRTGMPYSFTQIAVDRVNAADGHYDVMFIGTDVGTVLKVISVPKGSWSNTELLLEELQVFKDSSSIINMQISSKRQQLYVGSDTGVAQVPLHRCSMYGKACAECCLARDPYCAWDGHTCTRYLPNTKRRFRRQDVRNGDPNTLCSGDHQKQRVLEKKLYAVESSSSFLECIPKSLQAQVTWTSQRHPNNAREEVRLDDRVLQTNRGLLLRRVLRRDGGVYKCHAMEHGFTQTLLSITLEVVPISGPAHSRGHSPTQSQGHSPAQSQGHNPAQSQSQSTNQKLWYRDFMQLVDHPNLSTVDQICEQVWSRKHSQSDKAMADAPNESPPTDPLHSTHKKWKHLKEVRKGRNRRTHDGKPAPRAPRSAGE